MFLNKDDDDDDDDDDDASPQNVEFSTVLTGAVYQKDILQTR